MKLLEKLTVVVVINFISMRLQEEIDKIKQLTSLTEKIKELKVEITQLKEVRKVLTDDYVNGQHENNKKINK